MIALQLLLILLLGLFYRLRGSYKIFHIPSSIWSFLCGVDAASILIDFMPMWVTPIAGGLFWLGEKLYSPRSVVLIRKGIWSGWPLLLIQLGIFAAPFGIVAIALHFLHYPVYAWEASRMVFVILAGVLIGESIYLDVGDLPWHKLTRRNGKLKWVQEIESNEPRILDWTGAYNEVYSGLAMGLVAFGLSML